LTDQLPKKVWLAVGQKDWTPRPDATPIRIVRFTDALLTEAVEIHIVEGVPVKVFGILKTVADCFRYRHKIGLSVAIEGLQEALRQHKTTPGEIAAQAELGGVATVIRPYLEALTFGK
jgi:predicted transcriptional regulator of viral defense system